MAFELHSKLNEDCFSLGALGLSELLLMNDARFPWCILVPRMEGLRDLHDVPAKHHLALFDEIDRVSRALTQTTHAYKINVAALGNQVPQLHIHVIARHQDDAAWPAPVWGAGQAEPYSESAARDRAASLKAALGLAG